MTGELDVRYGLFEWATVEVSLPLTRNEMRNATVTTVYNTSSVFISDLAFRGLFDLLSVDSYRLTASVGGTVPFGRVSKRGRNAANTANEVPPFIMQGGSGTFDVLIGGTFQAQNETSSIGGEVNAVMRTANNRKGCRLGDEFNCSVWGAYNVSEWLSVSIRGLFERQGDISGTEAQTDGTVNPIANPFFQGGDRFWVPFGVNLYLREGRAAGHRLSLELYYPAHENLNGPQMSVESKLVASWQTVF